MNREQFFSMVKDVKKDSSKLQDYRKAFKNVYPFSDGVLQKHLRLGNENK